MNEDRDLFTGQRPVGPDLALGTRVLATASAALIRPSVPTPASWWPEVGLLAAALLLLAVNLALGGGRQLKVEEVNAAIDPVEQRELRSAGLEEFASRLPWAGNGHSSDVWHEFELEQL